MQIKDEPKWLCSPKANHFVQFYNSDENLINNLTKYVSTGLNRKENCVVIATKRHLDQLQGNLVDLGFDISSQQYAGKYLAIDAEAIISTIMNDDLSAREAFRKTMVDLVSKKTTNEAPLRIFDEAVMVLWKKCNQEAVEKLEKMWNDLIETYSFSLYCAYPELFFVSHHDIRSEFSRYHTEDYSSRPTIPKVQTAS